MEGKGIDERQMKGTEDKETSSQHGSGFHKNSDELITICGVEEGGNTLESMANGGLNQGAHPPFNVNPPQEGCPQANTIDQLANLNDGELLSQVFGGRQNGSSFDQIAAEGIEWWRKRMDKMSQEEFQQFYAALGILRGRVQTHLQQRIRIRDSNSGETSTSSSSTSTNGRARRR
ncbi:hypothetical protein SLEP1_g6241 [Rubroshorea leprosula]|uniref:Uncharacterized protein n=1 Tax=Rubroshorea leprosula TaxID=152421 RepID=A0AAV5HUJ5_9ROSI|nr:hypothetical protein SLEP1_g6241 [Rubroshorea leprosula]